MATLELLNKHRLIIWSNDRSWRPTPGSTYSRDRLVTVARKPLGPSEAEPATAWLPHAGFQSSVFISHLGWQTVQRSRDRRARWLKERHQAYCSLGEKGSFPTLESSRCEWLGISQLSKLFLLFPGQAPNQKCQSEAAPYWSIALIHLWLLGLGILGRTYFHGAVASSFRSKLSHKDLRAINDAQQSCRGKPRSCRRKGQEGGNSFALSHLLRKDFSSWKLNPELLWLPREQLW